MKIKRPTLLLASGFALLAVILALSLLLSQSQDSAFKWLTHTLEVQNRISVVTSRLQDAEAAQRGYIITGDESYLQGYDSAVGQLQPDFKDLARETADNARQQAAIARLRPLIAARIQSLAIAVGLRRSNGFQAAASRIAEGHGKILMNQIKLQLSGMQNEESRLLVERRSTAQRIGLALRVGRLVGLVILLALTAFGLWQSAQRLKEAKASASALEASNVELRREGDARIKAEGAVRQLQKMEAVGQLTGGIAHDFNNLLAVILGSLELAKKRLRGEPDRAEACLDSAHEAAQRAASLTARLLAFSRQQPLSPSPADPNALVGGMSELLRRTIGETVKVETVLAGGVWRINTDGQQLENAVLNLCVNARDAMPEGGRLTIETSNAYLDDAYEQAHAEVSSGQYVMISVTDTGSGMAPDVIASAFDPFYTTKAVGKGTGLGLSQVFGFVKQSGGHVKIYSEIGQGTSVKIYLPRWTGPNDQPSNKTAGRLGSVPRARGDEIVLVVEDDSSVRRVTSETLRDLGYTVFAAGSGEEAIRLSAELQQIDAMVTDIVMPEMNGRVLADRLVQERSTLKVLYVTGYTRNAIIHNGVLDAGLAFLAKPFTTAQLGEKLRQVIDGAGANR